MEENCAKTYGKGTNDYEGCMMGPCTLDRYDSDAEDPDAPRSDALDREECQDTAALEDCLAWKALGECDNASPICGNSASICKLTQDSCKATCGICEA